MFRLCHVMMWVLFSLTSAWAAPISHELSYTLILPDKDLETGISLLGSGGEYQLRDYAIPRHARGADKDVAYDRSYPITAEEYNFLWDLLTGRMNVWGFTGAFDANASDAVFRATVRHEDKRAEYYIYDQERLTATEPLGQYMMFLSSLPSVLNSLPADLDDEKREELFTTTMIYLLPKIGL